MNPSDISAESGSRNHPKLSKTLAWNGVFLQVPEAWEISGIERNHMIVSQEDLPKIELTWMQKPSRAPLEKVVKRFIAVSQKQLGITITEQAAREGTQSPHPTMDLFFFEWTDGNRTGNGVLIHCNHCHRLTILRIYSRVNWISPSLYSSILDSFRDHFESEETRWSVFGLKLSLPESMDLKSFAFNPGYFRLDFTQQKSRITLYSWGPATFLLSGESLESFVRKHIQLPDHGLLKPMDSDFPELFWEFHPPLLPGHSLPFKLNRPDRLTLCRVTHDKPANRILGILIEAPGPLAHDLLKQVNVDISART
ncbi:MAG: hypothetical protein D3926_16220 [Desulfobacteraceae bacterium]|nr:MAG: hypothetical protein D3926_16220 [Desulfobacteraceae bacterium]